MAIESDATRPVRARTRTWRRPRPDGGLTPAPGQPLESAPESAAESLDPAGPDQPVDPDQPIAGEQPVDGDQPVDREPGTDPEHPLGHLVVRELPEDFLTAADLSDQEDEAQRLHAELADVRAMLDRPLPPVRPVRHRGQRLILAGIAVAAVLIVAIAVLLAIHPWLGNGSTGKPAAQNGTALVNTAAVTASLLHLGLPATGPGADAPGVALGVQVMPDRSIAVNERTVFSGAGQRRFDLALAGPGDLIGDAAELDPMVDDLQVEINGFRVPATRTGARSWIVDAPDDPARILLVQYHLTDAVTMSTDSADGRGYGLIIPLIAAGGQDQGEDVVMRIPADGVLNVTCTQAKQPQSLCGDKDGSTWTAKVPSGAKAPTVLLQLDL